MSIFDFKSSREILNDKISNSFEKRGHKANLAKVMRVTPSFLSQLINGDAQLSPDQACSLCELWLLDQRQSEYFIELVNFERATTSLLKKRIEAKLATLRQGWQPVPKLEIKAPEIEIKNALRYYASWKPTAVLTACGISGIQTVDAIAKRLQLQESEVFDILLFLQQIGLIKRNGDCWESLGHVLGISSEFRELNHLFHQSVRERAFVDFTQNTEKGFHTTISMGLSKAAYMEIKEKVLGFTQQVADVVGPSTEEEVAFLAIDLFILNS
ncbi:MAG: TIGR02147 family protein [Proteobacteria bacterium]|nr:MAG: TIGR02147 family protein [Pseudomonadota bacterium]